MPSVSGRNYEIHSSPTQGRFLIASSTLPTGTLILTCEAFATAILDSHRKRLCAHCLSPSPTRTHTLRCSSCDQVYFCSLDCLSLSTRPQSSTTSTHASICSLLRKLATSKCSSHEKSIVKLIIMVYYQRRVLDEGTSDQFVKTGNEDDETKSSSGLGLTWTESLALQSHYTSWPSQSVKDWSQVTKWLNTHCQSLCEFPTPVETLMEWVSRIESNGFGIWALNKSESCMGRGLFPLASFFNHSCDPNCLVTQTQRVLEISTLREVEKGVCFLCVF